MTGLNDNSIEIVYLTFQNAFASAPHSILIKALAFYGIIRVYFTWIKNRLNGRPRNVVVNRIYQLTMSKLEVWMSGALSPVPSNASIRDVSKDNEFLLA